MCLYLTFGSFSVVRLGGGGLPEVPHDYNIQNQPPQSSCFKVFVPKVAEMSVASQTDSFDWL